jgi:hypothetical protein
MGAPLFAGGLALLAFLFVVWRLWRALDGERQVEPGGSYGRQVLGRYRKPKQPAGNDET